MKVLIINTVRFRLNGITSVIMNYYRNIDKSNMKIDFLVINKISNDYKKEFEKMGSDVYYFDRKNNVIKYICNLIKLLKNNKYDLVHIHGNSSLMAIETVSAYIAKVPVRIVHSHNTTCTHKILHNLLYPILVSTYTHGVACGEKAGKWLFRGKKFDVIKNGIDLREFLYNEQERNEYRKKLNANNCKIIGHVGNFVYQKNHEFIIDCFYEILKRDKNYMLLLISDGELFDEMKRKVERLGISDKVIFTGKTNEVRGYMQAMDFFVLPSHFEGLPVVLIEAQALGLKCFVSDKVSKEVELTNLIEFLPIDDSKVWCERIVEEEIGDRDINSKVSHDQIIDFGYDVSANANKLRSIYEKCVNEVKLKS